MVRGWDAARSDASEAAYLLRGLGPDWRAGSATKGGRGDDEDTARDRSPAGLAGTGRQLPARLPEP
jgi:hypothetical protein